MKYIKRYYYLIFYVSILLFLLGCDLEKNSDANLDIIYDVVEIKDISPDIVSDVSGDKGYRYIYEDRPFLQYESVLHDTNERVNSLVEYKDRIIVGRSDGLFIFENGDFNKVSIYGDDEIKRVLVFQDYLVIIKEKRVEIGDLNTIGGSREVENPIAFASSSEDRVVFGDSEQSLIIFENNNFSVKESEYKIRDICSSGDYYFVVTPDSIIKADTEFKNISLIVEGTFNAIDCGPAGSFRASSKDSFAIYDGKNIRWVGKGDKMPYPNLKSVRFSPYGVFALSDKGL
ncbi:MAG: hypothetical protein N2746_11795, partial [Deltaproteobacteria bacterium]|nr:hypothetical protein [Deltaproteobacteria bacterium]